MSNKNTPKYHITILDDAVQMASITTRKPIPYLKLLAKEYEGFSICVTKFLRNEEIDIVNEIIWEGTVDPDIATEIEL